MRFVYTPWSSLLATVVDLQGNAFTFTYNERNERTSLVRGTSGITQTWKYDADGNVVRDSVHNSGTGFPRYFNSVLRAGAFGYDGRGKLLRATGWSGLSFTGTTRQEFAITVYNTGVGRDTAKHTIAGTEHNGWLTGVD